MQKYLSYEQIHDQEYILLLKKLSAFAFIAVFQTLCYLFVNYISSSYPAVELYNLFTLIDHLIPYLGFTWFIYYSGDLFMFIWSFYLLQKLDEKEFFYAVKLYLIMIIIGAVSQLLIPARSPYPDELSYIHYYIHNNILDAPFGCFPSMHVALCIFPAFISFKYHSSFIIQSVSITWAILICISTMTLKEHYFLDVLAGAVLAITFALFFSLKYK